MSSGSNIPHIHIVVGVSAFVLIGFGVVSGWALMFSDDEVTKGNIIGTWQNFALLAVGFWIGSSSGSRARTTDPRPAGTPQDPVSVTETAA